MATQRIFCQDYNVRHSPSSKTIKRIVVKYITKGSVLNQQKAKKKNQSKKCRRPKEYRTVEHSETVRLSVIEDPKKSYWKRAQALNMKPTSLLTILRKDLKLIPYKCHTVQQLSNADKTARLAMYQGLRQE